MELHWSHANSGKYGAAGEGFSIRDFRTSTQIPERNPEDDFECTYFRQRSSRIPSKEKKSSGLFPMTIRYTLPSELSDEYTDSESETDNTSNVERWLESLPANDAWSSAPNYSALDGSEGVEGADEIQDDIAKKLEVDSGTCQNGIIDSRRSSASETGDSKINMTEGADLVSTKRNEICAAEARHDRKAPRRTIKRILKTRQKMPLWIKMEQQARTEIGKDKLSEEEANTKRYSVPEGRIPIDEKAVLSKGNLLETIESRTMINKPYIEEADYDKMMQEMVNRLLTVSAYRDDQSASENVIEDDAKTESFSKMDSVRNSDRSFDSRKSEESLDRSLTRLGMKRAKLSGTSKKFPPVFSKTKIRGNQRSKHKNIAPRTKARMQNPKMIRKISQGKQPSTTKRQLMPVKKNRYAMTSQTFVENVNPGKKSPNSRTVRFQDEVTTRTLSESWREAAMVKAARNKRILQTVEQIVDHIQSEGSHYGKAEIFPGSGEVQRASQDSICELETGDTVELNNRKSWWSNRKRPIHSIENKTIGSKKPMFTNPFVENCLDKAMDLALSKYKYPQNTWEDFNKEKLRENGSSVANYEPPAKKRKPKSSMCKQENIQRPDFSLLDSWQSIHNYFLLYSSCK